MSSRRAATKAQREERDVKIIRSIAAGMTVQKAADAHGVSKTTAHRALQNAKAVLPESKHARDLMLARFEVYRLALAPKLKNDPIKAVPRLLEVDTLEAKMRGFFTPQMPDGVSEVSGMLSMLIQRDPD